MLSHSQLHAHPQTHPRAQSQAQAQAQSHGARDWPEHHGSPGESNHLMDAEWLLSLCEGDGFSMEMLNDMMRFEPGLAA